MPLVEIGFTGAHSTYANDNNIDLSNIGRVVIVHKDHYLVRTESGELKAIVTGNFQHFIKNKTELPVVGDWVHFRNYEEANAVIIEIFPRVNCLERRAVAKTGEKQAIAANVDYGIMVEAVYNNFSLNRIERYIAICKSAKIKPLILLTKIDLIAIDNEQNTINSVKKRMENTPVFAVSNKTKSGLNEVAKHLIKGKTYCLLGLSGVGKSSLLNNLVSSAKMKTNALSRSTKKGVHTTSHRQLFLLDNGSILIDNPGMREIGLVDSENGMKNHNNKIDELAQDCRFSDCTHIHEIDCAVLTARENGALSRTVYDNYIKLKKDKDFFSATLVEKRQKDRSFGKMYKQFKKNKSVK